MPAGKGVPFGSEGLVLLLFALVLPAALHESSPMVRRARDQWCAASRTEARLTRRPCQPSRSGPISRSVAGRRAARRAFSGTFDGRSPASPIRPR